MMTAWLTVETPTGVTGNQINQPQGKEGKDMRTETGTELIVVETASECKALIAKIDALLDDDSISDADYDALDAKVRELIKMLPALEQAEKIAKLPQTSNKFVADVCGGFSVGTHTITIRQYDAVHNITRCTEFRCGGYLVTIAYGRTFCHLVKSEI